MDYKVNGRENIYFYVRLFVSLVAYCLLGLLIVNTFDSDNPAMRSVYICYAYAAFIIVYLFFRFGILIGHIKGNAVKLSKKQFPDIYSIVEKQSELLRLKAVPSVYILQSGGILNAFAARFFGHNYIVLYSEIVEAAYEQDEAILEFIIGHELGHIKRNHMLKSLILIPSCIVPFLRTAYSRACEYTSDNIGYTLAPKGVKGGLLLLASGKGIYKKVNVNEYLDQDKTEDGFWKWFAEKVSTHPNLTKRLAPYITEKDLIGNLFAPPVVEKKEDDLSRFMPK